MQVQLSATNLACKRGDKILFKELSFDLRAGDVLQIVGPNGTGKSSLLRILAGLLNAYQGKVFHKGAIGLIDERAGLDEDQTLEKSLNFWRVVDHSREELSLGSLENLKQVPFKYLSTGQKKRASIIRLRLQNPPIWLLDEPLNGLDKKAVCHVGNLVETHRLNSGICVLASHQSFPNDNVKKIDLLDYSP